VTTYFETLTEAMDMLAREPRAVFVGQGVGCAGTSMTDSLRNVPRDKLIEFPVAEDLQMGFCTGLAIEGWLPVCIFPRWNFLLLAANQLVNHLDRLPIYSGGGYNPKIIIRVAAPSTAPFYPGPQHDDDFTTAFEEMLRTVVVQRLCDVTDILPAYRHAVGREGSTLLVEYAELYKDRAPSGVGKKEIETVGSK
jgi:pyruvate/2-oxoglutarate/acetoin dehydrogenase E1 component